MNNNFKNIIAPIQEFLLRNGQCVGCGQSLKKGKTDKKNDNLEKVVCKCGRVYIFELTKKNYRRALLNEI